MFELNLFPTLRGVALLTVRTVSAFMLVIIAMTAIALHFRFLLIGPLEMASFTICHLMPTNEWELSVFVVIESQLLPIPTGVTLFTFLRVSSIVDIIDQMTGVTGLWGIFIVFIGMTQFTGQFSVASHQFIFSVPVVIELLL
jgi:hypothetical protein